MKHDILLVIAIIIPSVRGHFKASVAQAVDDC
jgi:hypothetical protein